jgi:hypothetical protein
VPIIPEFLKLGKRSLEVASRQAWVASETGSFRECSQLKPFLDHQIKDVVQEKILARSLQVEVEPGNIISDSREDAFMEICE